MKTGKSGSGSEAKRLKKSGMYICLTFSLIILISILIFSSASEEKIFMKRGNSISSRGAVELPKMKTYGKEEQEFCRKLMAEPRPCMFGIRGVHCDEEIENRKVMFSSNQQDYYLFTRHFKLLNLSLIHI